MTRLHYLSPSKKSGFECAHIHGEKDYFTPGRAKDRNAELLAVLEDAAKLTARLNESQDRCNKLFADQLELRRKIEVVLTTARCNRGMPTAASLKDLEDLL